MQATARIFFQKAPARRTKDDLCPVKLCITYKRERRFYSIKEKIKKNEWLFIDQDKIQKVMADSPRGKYKDIRLEYDRITQEAKDIINDLQIFSFNQFEKKFFNQVGPKDDVFAAMQQFVEDLRQEKRFGYATSFESTMRAIKEFHEGKPLTYTSRDKITTRDYLSGKKLLFSDITPEWLKKFELWMREKEKSRATAGIYIRNIRRLFNVAIHKYGIKAVYPFQEYQPSRAGDRKLALSPRQISLIANFDTDDPLEQFYRDMFIFSFLANGMNFSDIARLKCSDINGSEFSFVREKTKLKRKEVRIQVPITSQMQLIIDRHGTKAVGYDAFLFPVFKPGMKEEQQFSEVKEFIKRANKYLKQIAGEIGIKENISTYVARHSYATILKNAGASVEYIKEALGHSSVRVTEQYLKSFESDVRRKYSEQLEKVITEAS
jgi:integrase